MEFPAAEGQHVDHESDTWFIAGELSAATGRSFAFLTIFNRNRPGGTVVADFYTMALFDLDTGAYGTYTDYDMPPANLKPGAEPKLTTAAGHLDIRFDSDAGPATWTACRDDDGELLPCTYRVSLAGRDQAGETMGLELDVWSTRAPIPVGAARYNGRIACFGQPDTYSYFQPGMAMTGTLRWGSVTEQVSGSAGHIDRQWFPRYAGGGGTGGDPRARSHEWRTIHLNNGLDLSIWRQFDRANGNVLQPFSGATIGSPDGAAAPGCAEDVEVVVTSYVRWPDSVRPLLPPLSPARFLPDRHRLASAELQLVLTGEPLVAVPAHALPIEYMEGPYRYQGTMQGKPVSGFGIYERSLALYRDWELIDVLAAVTAGLPAAEPELTGLAERLRPLVAAGRRSPARELIQAVLPTTASAMVREVLEGLLHALSVED
ncbi:MAG: lipocalin-like domain-containing protein [Mycobacterium sp.]|uniref:lipocalin-like domain-containing protein n=1 Tax=Mycobacterium sp. TaxID=1785 RepID=UPI003CC579A9